VVTVSDSAAAGKREDVSGPAVVKELADRFEIARTEIIPDNETRIAALLRRLAKECDLIVTTGGTGIAERDVTPEATRAVCSRLVEGIAERMRAEGVKQTPLAALSRGVCGICGRALILNLPGSPKGAVESLRAVMEALPHAVELLQGKTEHKGSSRL
jgi:molybdenum cofactor synthesis domain-containing protein